ncbi:MAG: alpha/beta hydrolase fold domain-containing protein [Caldisericia bacterium]|nr:alpha/beta hydrolase fold domain-containing protein [Caldisericia bacterium]
MKNTATIFLILILALVVIFPTPGITTAEQIWKLGDRVIPGPLPPDFKKPAPELEKKLDISYGDYKKQKLDFFRPKICEGQILPLAVYIHGGGFTAGDKGRMSKRADSIMFSQLGFATASINYRLAPEVRMQTLIEDCKLAIRHLKANADELGIDPKRIGIWGTSAGGHLVGILCTADDDDGLEGEGLLEFSSRVSAVADIFGTSDFVTMFSQIDEKRAEANIKAFFGASTLEECYESAVKCSSVTYATNDDPPLLIQHGDRDPVVPYAQSQQFAKTMFSAGASCALIEVKNGGHGFGAVDKNIEVVPNREAVTFQCVAHLARYIEPAVLGDLNLDGKITIDDAINLAMLYGYQGTDAEGNPAPDFWNPLADIEPDGKIDIKDWNAFWEIF